MLLLVHVALLHSFAATWMLHSVPRLAYRDPQSRRILGVGQHLQTRRSVLQPVRYRRMHGGHTIAVSLVKYLQNSEITRCGRIWQNAVGRRRWFDRVPFAIKTSQSATRMLLPFGRFVMTRRVRAESRRLSRRTRYRLAGRVVLRPLPGRHRPGDGLSGSRGLFFRRPLRSG